MSHGMLRLLTSTESSDIVYEIILWSRVQSQGKFADWHVLESLYSTARRDGELCAEIDELDDYSLIKMPHLTYRSMLHA